MSMKKKPTFKEDITSEKYYQSLSYVGETIDQARKRIEGKRKLAKER